MKTKWMVWGVPAILLAIAAGIFLTNNANGNAQDTKNLRQAPEFSLPDIGGETFDSSSLKGKVVILNFWATWCPPCRREIPHLIKLQEKYRDQGLEVVGISMEDARTIKAFAEKEGINYRLLVGTRATADAFGGVRGIPTTFIINRHGEIVQTITGYRDMEFFEAAVKGLL